MSIWAPGTITRPSPVRVNGGKEVKMKAGPANPPL